jgi:hypothetical protein
MVIWMLSLGASIAVLIVTAATRAYYLHMAAAGAVSILVALASFQEARSIGEERRQAGLLASSSFRHMGLVWTWGALALLVTYSFILSWREWWQFFIGFMVLAGLCLFLSATLRKDAEAGSSDATMFKVASGLSIFFMIAMVGVMAGLLIDGKLWRFTTVAGQRIGSQDWAANNVFFFGALAIGAVSWNAYTALRKV